MTGIFLGVDVGTISVKCLAVSNQGRQVAFSQQRYSLEHPHPGWAEQDPEDYWDALVKTVSDCVEQWKAKGGRAQDFIALAISSQGDTLLALDELGNPLAPALSWMDIRAEDCCAHLLSLRDAHFWYRSLGIPLTPASSACKILWYKEHQPDVFDCATLCYIPEFLAKRLTGHFVSDQSGASWNPLFSSHQNQYNPEILDLLHMDGKPLAQVIPSGQQVGRLLPRVAELLGVTEEARLIAGAFDQAAAAHGTGGEAVLSCGTAWVLYAITDNPVLDSDSGVPFCLHCQPGKWGMVLPFPGGAVFDWVRSLFPDALYGLKQEQIYSGSRPLCFIPHFYGALAPDWKVFSRGSLVGMDLSTQAGDILIAAMTGIACEARRNLEAAEAFSGSISQLRMVGGAAQSELWTQIVADILQRPVYLSSQSESAAFGAARLAAGDLSVEWKTAEEEKVFLPTPEVSGWATDNYYLYLQTYKALLPVLENAQGTKGSSY